MISRCSSPPENFWYPAGPVSPGLAAPRRSGSLRQPKWQHTPICSGISLTLRLSLPQLVLKAVFKRSPWAYAGAEFKSSLGKGGEGTRGSIDCLSQLHTSSQIDLANLITDTTNSRLTPDEFLDLFPQQLKHLFNE